jgi:hypothetical protein
VKDDAEQLAMRDQIEMSGSRITPVIDRFWFKSVYFREPGGVLFEIATDGPGFTTDEDPSHLGETLVLPPWLERMRGQIEAKLPSLTLPRVSTLAASVSDLGFEHVFRAAPFRAPTLLLLHSTDGNEHDLIPLAEEYRARRGRPEPSRQSPQAHAALLQTAGEASSISDLRERTNYSLH